MPSASFVSLRRIEGAVWQQTSVEHGPHFISVSEASARQVHLGHLPHYIAQELRDTPRAAGKRRNPARSGHSSTARPGGGRAALPANGAVADGGRAVCLLGIPAVAYAARHGAAMRRVYLCGSGGRVNPVVEVIRSTRGHANVAPKDGGFFWRSFIPCSQETP